MSILLADITVGNTVFRVSKKGYRGEHFYHPFVQRMPTLELGQVEDSGKVGVKFGFLTLTNEPLNADHPFGLSRYERLFLTQQEFPCSIRWGEGTRDLFVGNLFLQTITDTEISFALTDTAFELGARPFSLTENFSFVENIRSSPAETSGVVPSLLFTAENHGFQIGSVIIFERMTTIGINLQYTPAAWSSSEGKQSSTSDNFFFVDSVPSVDTFTILNKRLIPVETLGAVPGSVTNDAFTSNGQDHRVGIPQRVPFSWGTIEHRTPVLKKRSNEIANPNLVYNQVSTPILVHEDGVLIYHSHTGTEYWNEGTVSGTNNFATSTINNANTITITCSNAHQLILNQTVYLDFSGTHSDGVYVVNALGDANDQNPSTIFRVVAFNSNTGSGTVTVAKGVAPTATVITLNRKTTQGSTLSISGTSDRGNKLSEFFQYVATAFGFSIDITKIGDIT